MLRLATSVCVGAKAKNGGKKKAEPPYARYAFVNPYNLSLLAGTSLTAVATGHTWMVVCAAAGEALWMLFAPGSRMLQRAWFDGLWRKDQADEARKRLEAKFQSLPAQEQQRALGMREQQSRIHKLARENPAFTVELLRNDLEKLEGILEDYIDIAVNVARCEEHLRSFDISQVERGIHGYQKSISQFKEGDPRRSVAQKNLDVLLARRERHGELVQFDQAARGQMDLVENTFRLLCDDIVSMNSGNELSRRVDDLRGEMEAVRATTRVLDDEAIMEEEVETEAQARMRR